MMYFFGMFSLEMTLKRKRWLPTFTCNVTAGVKVCRILIVFSEILVTDWCDHHSKVICDGGSRPQGTSHPSNFNCNLKLHPVSGLHLHPDSDQWGVQ